MSKIRVCIREPRKVPRVKWVENEAHVFHEIIGDFFDVGYPFVRYDQNLLCLVGDESLLDGSAFNFSCPHQDFCGTAIFVRRAGPEFVSLTGADLEELSGFFGGMLIDPVHYGEERGNVNE